MGEYMRDGWHAHNDGTGQRVWWLAKYTGGRQADRLTTRAGRLTRFATKANAEKRARLLDERDADEARSAEAADLRPGQRIDMRGTVVTVLAPPEDDPSDTSPWPRPGMLRIWGRREDTGTEGWALYGPGARVTLAPPRIETPAAPDGGPDNMTVTSAGQVRAYGVDSEWRVSVHTNHRLILTHPDGHTVAAGYGDTATLIKYHRRMILDEMAARGLGWGSRYGHAPAATPTDTEQEETPMPSDTAAPASYTYHYETYGPKGFVIPKTGEITAPLYHGGRARLRPGQEITTGRKTNPWGDEGERSQFVHFATELEAAAEYARACGPRGRLYEVEPTGEFQMGYEGREFKSRAPLRVIREVPREEWAA